MARLTLTVDPSGAEQGYRRAGAAAEAYKRDAWDAATATDKLSGSFRSAKDAIFSVQGALAGLGVGVGLKQSLQAFADFERGLVGIGKTADLEGQALAQLGERVQRLGREIPVATEQLLGIGQAAGQLGVQGADNIARFTETVAKLGTASNLAGEQAATTLARLLNVTGENVASVDRLGSVLVELGNTFAATEAEIASVAERVAQATARFGTSSAEASAFGAAMRSLGIEAEAGGTAVGRAFEAINAAVTQGGSELATLERVTGQTGETLRRTFQNDAVGAVAAFIDALGDIPASEQATVLEQLGLSGQRVVQVIGTLANRSEVLGSALNSANAEYEANIALNAEAAKAAGTFSSQMTTFGNLVNEAAVALGAGIAPALQEVTGGMRDALTAAQEAGEIREIGEDIGDALAFAADNAGLLLAALQGFVTFKAVSLFGNMALAIGSAATAMRGFNLAFRANPIGIAAAPVGGMASNRERLT